MKGNFQVRFLEGGGQVTARLHSAYRLATRWLEGGLGVALRSHEGRIGVALRLVITHIFSGLGLGNVIHNILIH